MRHQPVLRDAAQIVALSERLSRCSEVTRFTEGEHDEASTLAHAFADLEESFQRFLEDQLPRVVNKQLQASQISDLLLEIGEEFRHILYHLKDPKFYRYLHEQENP